MRKEIKAAAGKNVQVARGWVRPEVRRVRAGAAETTSDDSGGDIVFS